MQQLLQLSTKIHIISIFFTLCIILLFIFTFYKEKDYVVLTRRYERYTLFYYFFLSSIIFTGLILFTLIHFQFSLKVSLMILATIHLIVTSIKLYIKFKQSRLKDKESQKTFITYTRKKFIIDATILIIIGILSYAIHI